MAKSSKSQEDSSDSSSDSSIEEDFKKEALGEKESDSDKKENLISKKDSSDKKLKTSKNKEKDSDSSSKKKKKSKKSKKKKDRKEKKIHKSDKDKKKKHHKKHHKKDKKKKQKKYGKYGLITMFDMPMKKEDFIHWLREIKSINIEAITHTQEKKFFEEYMEDYNTCSFPSKKYYSLREWEQKQEGKKVKEMKGVNNDNLLFMTDEANLMDVRKKETLKFQMEKVHAALYQLNNNQEMIQGMKEEQELKDKMKHYYKIGKTDEAQKISKMFEINKEFKNN